MHNPQSLPSLRRGPRPRNWAGPVAVVALALTLFGWDLPSEPHFVDESAYISQSLYADLLLDGRVDDPAWSTYAGYDLPPLPKYLIGGSLRSGGFRRPGPSKIRDWYANTSRRFVSEEALTVARIPSVLLGGLGCLALYAIGSMAGGRAVGIVSAGLLMGNPLYRMHARRAMSDVPAEAFLLMTLAVGLWAWRRSLSGRGVIAPALILGFGSGTLCGLSTLSKLNGALAGFVIAAWATMALGLGTFPIRGRLAFAVGSMMAGSVAFGTFAALNPFLYAQPDPRLDAAFPRGPLDPPPGSIGRLSFARRVGVIYDHRAGVSDLARRNFPHNALNSPGEKVKAVAIQGFGRFGPLGPRGRTDSTRRYDFSQDWGAIIWLPTVAVGLGVALARGRKQAREGEPPGAWAVVAQASVALVVVTAFIPLAWDRYFLSIQPGCAILGAFALVEGGKWLTRTWMGRPRSEPAP